MAVALPITTQTLPPRNHPNTHITPNTNLCLLLLCNHLQEAKQIHTHMIKSTQISDRYSASRLAEFYAVSDHGSLDYAEEVLNSIQKPYTFIWNTLLRGYLKVHDPLNAIILYRRMLESSVGPDHFTFTFLLKACTQLPALAIGRQFHSQIVKRGIEFNAYIRNKLIHMYAISGLISDARKVFDGSSELDIVAWNSMLEGYANSTDGESLHLLFEKMPHRDVVSWNTLIAFYVQICNFEEAVNLFRLMQESKVLPNQVTLITVLSAVAHLGALAQGRWIHAYIEKNTIELNENLCSSLINMYSKCGCLDGAIQAFKMTKQRSVDTWNAMISGISMNGRSIKGLELFLEMVDCGIRPNAISFSCVLNACSHAGLVSDGVGYFKMMTEVYRIEPDIAHYGCMIDLFARAGMFEKVDEMMRVMPMEPDVVMWKALLAACRIHRNFEMGKRASIQLMALAPNDNASYVLLSNMYAMADKWDGVSSVRKTMLERGVKKIPGCSSIELDGIVHEFMAGDTSHAQKKEIYVMLDEMRERLKLAGHEPDTKQVLLDIDEEEVKQTSLNHHSEKLAVAFGFIRTKPLTTIRIVKNLRVCGDCHSAIKLLSKIYSRDIIVRDSNRFHHFSNGSCSCMDYW